MSKLPQEEAQSIAYYDEFKAMDHTDYDAMIEFFNKVNAAGYGAEATIMEDEWTAENREHVESIKRDWEDLNTYRSMQYGI